MTVTSSLPTYPVWKFGHEDSEFLYLKFRNVELRVRFWPNSQAQYRVCHMDDWRDGTHFVHPLLSPQWLFEAALPSEHSGLPPNVSIDRAGETAQLSFYKQLATESDQQGGYARPAIYRAMQRIPHEILLILPYFACHPWDTLVMASRSKAIADLITSTPMLFYLWSREVDLSSGRFIGILNEFVQRRQTEQLGEFGFPKSKSWIGILRKIHPEDMSRISVEKLALFAHKKPSRVILKYLQHCTLIHREAFHLISNPDLWPYIEQSLQNGYLTDRSVSQLKILYNILPKLLGATYLPRDLPIPKSIVELSELADLIDIAENTYRKNRDWQCLSPFKTPRDWVHLDTTAEIIREGFAQKLCLIEDGRWFMPRHYLYRVNRPVRATLLICRMESGRYKVLECAGYANRSLSKEHVAIITERINERLRPSCA